MLNLDIEALSSLCCHRWLFVDVIHLLCEILNKQAVRSFNIVLSSVELRRLKDFCPPLQSLEVISMPMCVGMNEDQKTFPNLSDKGMENHYAVAIYLVDNNTLIYCDLNGWPIPSVFIKDFLTALKEMTSKETASKLKTRQCHVGLKGYHNQKHKRSKKYASYFPLQNCSTICGISCCVTMCIAALDVSLFKNITSSKEENCVPYLWRVSDYYDFLRLTIFHGWRIDKWIFKILPLAAHTKSSISERKLKVIIKLPTFKTRKRPMVFRRMRYM